MVVRTGQLLAGATLLLAGGCFYNFNNPVAAQSSGSIAGQLVLSDEAPGQTLSGSTVSLQWSGLTIPVDKSNGRFLFVGLPAGTFTLRYDLPAKAGNQFPLVGFRHNLVLPGGPGAADAVNLGAVPITPSGRVEGVVSGGNGAPIVLGAFTPDAGASGGGEFEGYTATTDSAGAFSLLLPAGNHDLACSTTSAVDAQPVTLQSQQVVTKNLGVAPASVTDSSVTGFLVFGDLGANADPSAVDSRKEFIATTVVADDGTTVTTPVQLASQVPGAGLSFQQDLPPGHDYTVTFQLTAAQDPLSCNTFPPLVLPHIPGLAGQTTQLGQVAWLQKGVFIANGGAGVCGDGGVVADAGPAWQMLNAAAPQDAGAVIELVPLPIGDGAGGTKGHRLAWVQADGLVYTADDVISGGTTYGPTEQIWSDAVDPVFAITGTSTAAGGAAFGWVERNLQQATIAYYPPGNGSESALITSFLLPLPPSNQPSAMSLVAGTDSTGTPGLWVLILEDASTGGLLEFWFTSDFSSYARAIPVEPTTAGADAGADAGPTIDAGPTLDAGLPVDAGPTVATLKAGQIAGAPCSVEELDGGQGVCIAATVNWVTNDHWAYGAVLDTRQAPPVLAIQLIVDAGAGQNFGSPAITAAPPASGSGPSSVATGWTLAAIAGPEYQVSQFTTLSTTPTPSVLTSPYGPLDPDGILLQWQGSPLAVATFPLHSPHGVGSVSLGTVTPPPFLPGFGVAQQLHGYTAANGDLYIAAYDRAATNMTTQLGLFVWPPQF